MNITGTSGDDDLDGTGDFDLFDMSQGGDDIVHALAGSDEIYYGAVFDRHDRVFGGNGTGDTLELEGNYDDLQFAAQSIDSIEEISLFAGFDYELHLHDENVGAGQNMLIYNATNDSAHSLIFDGHLETDGTFSVAGGAGDDAVGTGKGDDAIETGAGDDIIDPGHGRDGIGCGDGNDVVVFQFGGFGASDSIDAGDGLDRLLLAGDYSVTFKKFTIQGVESILLNGGSSYSLTLENASLPDGGFFAVDGSQLGAHKTLFVDGSGARHYFGYSLAGGAGADVLIGSVSGDYFFGGGGADEMTGGDGSDVFFHQSVSHSTGPAFDTIIGFDAHHDGFDPGFTVSPGEVAGFDGKVTGGRLSIASFNHDLENAIAGGELAADHAVLYEPAHGDFAGALFLIVDGNGVAGYQGNDDLVVRFTDATHMKDFSANNFGNVA